MNEFFKWTSNIASILAIATFIYAIWIERKLEEFKKRVLFNTRVAHLVDDLNKENSSLSKLLEQVSEQERELKVVFFRISSTLDDLRPKLPRSLQQNVDGINSTFFRRGKFFKNRNVTFVSGNKPQKGWHQLFLVYYNEADLEDLYAKIDALTYRIENSIKDNEILP